MALWRSLAASLALVLALLGGAYSQEERWSCRFAPGSRHSHCGLPYSLSNFQGYYACNETVKVGRPRTVEELQSIVEAYPKVKAVGVGHSWWADQFCAGNTSDAVNVVTTELLPVLDFIQNPVDPAEWLNRTIPDDFPIQVDEANRTVTVAAGVPQRMLLDYLAAYTHWDEPAGWTLPAYTWFIDQTIGGAVATASHGSSMKHGSLSSQVLEFKVVLANGTEATITPTSHPHLFWAMGTSVGRLGVITELTMKIIPQEPVKKSVSKMTFGEFADQVTKVQDEYLKAKAANDTKGMKDALFALDETQAFWFVANDLIVRTDYDHPQRTPEGVILNIDSTGGEAAVQGMDAPEDDAVFDQRPHEPQAGQPRLIERNASYWGRYFQATLNEYAVPGVYDSRKAFLSQTEPGSRLTANFAPYDQFEVAVPMEVAGTCLQEIDKAVYEGPDALYEGFRTPPLIRFISGEEFYLSPAHRGNGNLGPTMYINLEDYLSHTTGEPNEELLTVLGIFRDKCQARLHWGKNGWPQFASCFDGSIEYPDSWCHFGCAVEELDSGAKFIGQSDVWFFNATRAGGEVPFASCCTPNGFDAACQCGRRTECAAAYA